MVNVSTRCSESGQPPVSRVSTLSIRDDVARSWKRSRMCGIDPTTRPALPFEPERVDTDNRVWRAARPVLARFAEMLAGTPTLLVLADREARGLETWLGDAALDPMVEAIGARSGYRWAEELIGTNGIGTPIETSRPIFIAPGEHFVDSLKPLTCAGVPIRHPLTGRLDGVVNLTSTGEDKQQLLLRFALEIARQIQEELYAEGSVAERFLLQHFLAATRSTSRPVVVLSQEMMLANPPALRLLEHIPHAVLWEQAARSVTENNTTIHEFGVAEDTLLVRCVPIEDGDGVAGVTVEIEPPTRALARRSPRPRPSSIPGLVGNSAGWRRVCEQVHTFANNAPRSRGVVAGEPGVGKLAVAAAMVELSTRRSPHIVNGALADTQPGWLADLQGKLVDGPVVISHVECLSQSVLAGTCAILDELNPSEHSITATLTVGETSTVSCAPLLDRLSDFRIDIPAIRHRTEDITELVTALLQRLSAGGRVRNCSSEAVQVLSRFAWPGNVRQLEAELRAALARSDGPAVALEDLSQEVRRAGVRRNLTLIEGVELDAILAALNETNGNKLEAAARLGMSRSTLYRKIRTYGLDLHQTAF